MALNSPLYACWVKNECDKSIIIIYTILPIKLVVIFSRNVNMHYTTTSTVFADSAG